MCGVLRVADENRGFAEIVLARLVGGYDSHRPFIRPSRLAPLAGKGETDDMVAIG
jgi:hypothetical protein